MKIISVLVVSVMFVMPNSFGDDKLAVSGFMDCSGYNKIIENDDDGFILEWLQTTLIEGYLSGRNMEQLLVDGEIADLRKKYDFINDELNSFCKMMPEWDTHRAALHIRNILLNQ